MKSFCRAVLVFIREGFGSAREQSADIAIEVTQCQCGSWSVMVRPEDGKSFRFEVEVDPETTAEREDLDGGGVKFTSHLPLKVDPASEFTGEDGLVRVRLMPCPEGTPHDHVVVQVPNDATLVREIGIRSAIVSAVVIPLDWADHEEVDVEVLEAEAEAAYDAAGLPPAPASETD